MTPLRILIVDDEALARSRLRTLLGDCASPATEIVGEAAHGDAALEAMAKAPVDVVLLDIHMPGIDGIELARSLRSRPNAPAVVFITAHAAHAVTAFDLEAIDYLTKPVRAERLKQALQKAERFLKDRRALPAAAQSEVLIIQDRGRTERVPLAEVLYLKSEFKYLTVRTADRSYLYDGALAELEERFPGRFVRVHRNALVARAAIRSLVKHDGGEEGEGEGWSLRLEGIPEPVVVSRRQLTAVREALREQA